MKTGKSKSLKGSATAQTTAPCPVASAAAEESLHRFMRARAEARAKQMGEQERQKEAIRTAQERRAKALRALDDFTRKQMRPPSTATQGKQPKKSSPSASALTRRKTTTVIENTLSKGSTADVKTPLNLMDGKENGPPATHLVVPQNLSKVTKAASRKVAPLQGIADSSTVSGAKRPHLPTPRSVLISSNKPRQRSAADTLLSAQAPKTTRRSLAVTDIAASVAKTGTEEALPKKKEGLGRRRSMLPSTSASLAALVADESSDHAIAASAPVSTEVSMESSAPSANTSLAPAATAPTLKPAKKRRVSIAEAGFAQPTIAARMRVAATTGNNQESEKVEAIIERRKKRSASLSAGLIAGLGLPALASNASLGEKRTDKRPTGVQPATSIDQRLEKRRKAREERELIRMRAKITASMERGRNSLSPRVAGPASLAARSDASTRDRPLKRDPSRRTTNGPSSAKPSCHPRVNGSSLQQPHSKEPKRRYASICPKDLSSLSFSLDEKDAAGVCQEAKRSESSSSGETRKEDALQKAEELDEMLSHYTDDESTDSDDDVLADEKTEQRADSEMEDAGYEPRNGVGYGSDAIVECIQEEEAQPIIQEWKLRICAAVGQRLTAFESEELLWDVVDEALAYVLPNPAYTPSTLAEESTLTSLVQKKITDWMSYGKGRDDVDAMLRAELTEKHERWEEVERREIMQLVESFGMWRDESPGQQRTLGEAF